MQFAYVLLIFFTFNGEPVAKSEITKGAIECPMRAMSMAADMKEDPAFQNIVLKCERVLYRVHQPI